MQQEAPAGSIPLFHKVKPGETLFSISKRYKVPVETIKSINHLQKPYTIRPGDRIKIR